MYGTLSRIWNCMLQNLDPEIARTLHCLTLFLPAMDTLLVLLQCAILWMLWKLSQKVSQSRQRDHAEQTRPGQKHIEQYTKAFPRIMLAYDGDQPCSALLLRSDLSEKIKRAVRFQQKYREEDISAKRQINAIDQFKRTLTLEIINQERLLRLTVKEQANLDPDSSEDVCAVRSDLAVLRQLEKIRDSERKICKTTISNGAETLLELHIEVMLYLEKAFVDARMVDPKDKKPVIIQELDLEDEFYRISGGRILEPAPETGGNPSEEEIEEYEQEQIARWNRKSARQSLQEAIKTYESARDRIKANTDRREKECSQHRQAELDGRHAESKEDFDLHWADLEERAAQELANAEEAMNKARSAAVDAGVRVEEHFPSPVNAEEPEPDCDDPIGEN